MGRGKVQLKRIEDRNSRQVTFSKRKGGMMKKARELSVLCDVEVAFLIFSDRGRLYKFCSAESIEKTLNRYQMHVEEEVAARRRAEQKKKNLAECTDVQTRDSPLEIVQRCLENLDIEQKNMTELTQLERELDAILRQARFRKNRTPGFYKVSCKRAVKQCSLVSNASEGMILTSFSGMQNQLMIETIKALQEEVEMAATRSENPESSHSRLLEMESNTYSEGDPPPAQQTILRLFNF